MQGLRQSSIGEGILRVRDPAARCLRTGRLLRLFDRDHRGSRSRGEKRGRIISSICRASPPSSRSNDSLGTLSLTFSDAITFDEHLVLVPRFEVFVTFPPLVFLSRSLLVFQMPPVGKARGECYLCKRLICGAGGWARGRRCSCPPLHGARRLVRTLAAWVALTMSVEP